MVIIQNNIIEVLLYFTPNEGNKYQKASLLVYARAFFLQNTCIE